jgi:endonuclease VIII
VPEGNEVHRWANRFTGAALLSGRKLKSVIAHGKHLAYDFGRDRKLH